jgi:hypothetical protein
VPKREVENIELFAVIILLPLVVLG